MDLENFCNDMLEPLDTIKNGSNSARNYLLSSPEYCKAMVSMREEYGYEAFFDYLTLAQETLDRLKQINLKRKFKEHIGGLNENH